MVGGCGGVGHEALRLCSPISIIGKFSIVQKCLFDSFIFDRGCWLGEFELNVIMAFHRHPVFWLFCSKKIWNNEVWGLVNRFPKKSGLVTPTPDIIVLETRSRHCHFQTLLIPGLLPETPNCELCIRRECRERFPCHRLQRKPPVGDHGMHHGTCVTHMPWFMSGSLTRGGGENVSGIPSACAHNFAYLVRGPWWWRHNMETLSALPLLYWEIHPNPKRASDVKFWCFFDVILKTNNGTNNGIFFDFGSHDRRSCGVAVMLAVRPRRPVEDIWRSSQYRNMGSKSAFSAADCPSFWRPLSIDSQMEADFIAKKYPGNTGQNGSIWGRCWYWEKHPHNVTIAWQHFPHCRPFMSGIHQWSAISQHNGQLMRNFDVFSLAKNNCWTNSRSAVDLRATTFKWHHSDESST